MGLSALSYAWYVFSKSKFIITSTFCKRKEWHNAYLIGSSTDKKRATQIYSSNLFRVTVFTLLEEERRIS